MRQIQIEESSDSRLADYRNISEAELVLARGLFVAEGRIVVRRLLEDGRCIVRSLLLSSAAYRDLTDVLTAVSGDMPVYVCKSDDFLPITGLDIHRGCLALAERPADVSYPDLLDRARRVVVLDAVANADNVGGIFRNAAAFGVDAVLLGPTCCDPLYRKAIRTSMAATLRVPFSRVTPWPAGLAELRRRGFTIAAFTLKSGAQTLKEFARVIPPRVACVFGSEGSGLSEDVESMADVFVRIPMRAEIDSLNVAVTTGIALAHLTEPGDLA